MDGKQSIYADHASTTRLDPVVFEAMLPFLQNSYGNPSSLHSFGRAARKALESARQEIAHCIGATPEEVFFTSCGTEGNNWAVKGSAHALRSEGTHLIASAIEHHAVLECCAALDREGFTTALLPVDCHGLVSVEDLHTAITPRTTFVSIMLANNEIGTILDIRDLVAAAHQHGLVFHSDAVQALGHIPVHVDDLGVDLLSASSHKFNGPKGIGFLYRRNGIRLTAYLDGGRQEAGERAGTENVAGIVGMACALKTHLASLSDNMRRLQLMEEAIKARVSAAFPDVRFNGHPKQHLPGLVSLSFPDISGESLLHLLDLEGIFVSTGAACTSKDLVVSHVLQAIELPAAYSAGTLRISLSKDNTEAEAVAIAAAVVSATRKLRR